MTIDELLQVLQLPESTRVQQRVPKKLLIEHGAATPQDSEARKASQPGRYASQTKLLRQR